MTGISAGSRLSYLGGGQGGSLDLSYRAVTSTYVVSPSDYMVDATSGTFTITLPTAAGDSGSSYCIKNSGSGLITVDGNGSETIDGSLTFILGTQYEAISVISDGANWKVI